MNDYRQLVMKLPAGLLLAAMLLAGCAAGCSAGDSSSVSASLQGPSPPAAVATQRGTKASAATSGFGAVQGTVPLCFGPGPDNNLHPRIAITARGTDGKVVRIRTSATEAHHHYRMSLPADDYTISTYTGTVRVTVTQGATAHADLPQPGCL